MRKIAITAVLIILAAVARAEPAIRVGIVVPLSGPVADYGIAVRNGIGLARQKQPSAFRNIELIFEDSRYDNAATLAAFQKLQNVDRVQLTFVWGYGPVQAVAPIAEARHIPLLAASANTALYRNARYVLRFCLTDKQYAQALAAQLRRLNFKKLAVLKSDVAFLEGVADRLREEIKGEESIAILTRLPRAAKGG